MSYREYWVWCPKSTPAIPPPIDQQITNPRGYQSWGPTVSCLAFDLQALPEDTPREFQGMTTWPQGRYMYSSDEMVDAVQHWFRCRNHPDATLQIFRQHVAYSRRFDKTIHPEEDHYRIERFGTPAAPWPEWLEPGRDQYTRWAYFPKRIVRSTASLWE